MKPYRNIFGAGPERGMNDDDIDSGEPAQKVDVVISPRRRRAWLYIHTMNPPEQHDI